jgi:hypothetical protein
MIGVLDHRAWKGAVARLPMKVRQSRGPPFMAPMQEGVPHASAPAVWLAWLLV